MYIPEAFAETRRDRLTALIEQFSFGTLVSNHNGRPYANHLPFMVDAEAGLLLAHMARANPQWRSLADGQQALVIFQGPHAYVSPAWHRSSGVPTWNYAVVHVYGMAKLIEEPDQLAALVQRLTAVHEAGQAEPRLVDFSEDRMKLLLSKIVGIEISIAEIQGKFKLSQNRPVEDCAEVIRQLRAGGSCCGASLAELMEAT
jgi:transcriptional regulator